MAVISSNMNIVGASLGTSCALGCVEIGGEKGGGD